jgi:hypothetical protein
LLSLLPQSLLAAITPNQLLLLALLATMLQHAVLVAPKHAPLRLKPKSAVPIVLKHAVLKPLLLVL